MKRTEKTERIDRQNQIILSLIAPVISRQKQLELVSLLAIETTDQIYDLYGGSDSELIEEYKEDCEKDMFLFKQQTGTNSLSGLTRLLKQYHLMLSDKIAKK